MKSIKCFQIVSSECHSTEPGSSLVLYFRNEKKKENQLRKDQLLAKLQHDQSTSECCTEWQREKLNTDI